MSKPVDVVRVNTSLGACVFCHQIDKRVGMSNHDIRTTYKCELITTLSGLDDPCTDNDWLLCPVRLALHKRY